MNKKILLISFNARYSHSNLAVYYLYQALSDNSFKPEIFETSINTPEADTLSSLYDSHAEVYCFSVYIWNVSIIKRIAVNLKKLRPDSVIVFGGPEVSYNPENYTDVADFIISGPGEKALVELAESDFDTEEQIHYGHCISFEETPNPYRDIDLDQLKNKILYYETSRGCIFKCEYCLSSREDMVFQRKSIETVSEELDYVLSYNPTLIKFVDRSFNCDREYSLKLWKTILTKDSETKYHFEIHPSFITDEDIAFLETVPEDKFQFEIGIQSTDDEVNKAVSRYQKWESIKPQLLKLLHLRNIHSHVDMITGLPKQDFNSASKTLNDLFNTKADHIQIGFLKILPGTPVINRFQCLAYTVEPPYEVLSTDWMSYEQIRHFKKIAFWTEILHNSGKFSNTCNWLMGNYCNAVDFFGKLIEFEKKHPLTNNRWLTVAEHLLEMTHSASKELRKICVDYLRWDWCLITKNLHYPELLKQEKSKSVRKLLYEKYSQHDNNMNIVNILKKSILFIPESDDFSLSDSDDTVLFYTENNIRKNMHISMKGVFQ